MLVVFFLREAAGAMKNDHLKALRHILQEKSQDPARPSRPLQFLHDLLAAIGGDFVSLFAVVEKIDYRQI